MKVWAFILILVAGLCACSKGIGKIITNNNPDQTATLSTSPNGQAAVDTAELSPKKLSAAAAALTTNSQFGLFLTGMVEALDVTSMLNVVSNDTDTETLSLADNTDATNPIDATQAQSMEIQTFIGNFFSTDRVLSKDTCSQITDHMAKRISHAQSWLTQINTRIACIDKAGESLGGCWTSAYAMWLMLKSTLGVLVSHAEKNKATLQDLCLTYFTENPGAVISKEDLASVLILHAAVMDTDTDTDTNFNTDTNALEQTSTTTSLVSDTEARSATKKLLNQARQIRGQLASKAKPEARACMAEVQPPARKSFMKCWNAVVMPAAE